MKPPRPLKEEASQNTDDTTVSVVERDAALQGNDDPELDALRSVSQGRVPYTPNF